MPLESAALIKTLNKTCVDALQAAAGLCVSRTNYNVEVEHWLLKLVEAPNTDLTRIFPQFEVDTSKLLRDLTRAIDGFKTGNARTPSLAPPIESLVREAWLLTSLQYQWPSVRSGVLLLALLGDRTLGQQARDSSAELAKIPAPALQAQLAKLTAGSPEEESPADREPGGASGDAFDPSPCNPVARPVHGEPHAEGEGGEDRPGDRARGGSPSNGRYSDSQTSE